jgi:hypothetical protein
MDEGLRQIKTAGACRGVDGAWGVAGWDVRAVLHGRRKSQLS